MSAQAWTSDTLGGIEDVVELTIGDAGTTRSCESYDVRQAFFTQAPNVWAVRLGTADSAYKLIQMGVPRQKIELSVGGALQQTGWTDGPEAENDAGAGTTVTLHGRDRMAELHDAHILRDKSFKNQSFASLTEAVLLEALGPTFDFIPVGGNLQARQISSGGSPPPQVPDDDIAAAITGPKANDIKAKFGEKWWDFLKKQLDRAGLFLITGPGGEFILCRPNKTQAPSYRILREKNAPRNVVSVIKAHYKNTAQTRYTTYEVHGRGGASPTSGIVIPPDAPDDVRAALLAAAGGGGQKGIKTQYIDQEMLGWGFPLSRAWCHKDPHATSPAHLRYLAQRKCAEDRRRNWQLTYTVPGHTWPSLRAGGKRITWTIDSVVEVIDQEFGLSGNFWIEAIQFARSGTGTTTTLTLMRPEDLVFGDPT